MYFERDKEYRNNKIVGCQPSCDRSPCCTFKLGCVENGVLHLQNKTQQNKSHLQTAKQSRWKGMSNLGSALITP